MASKHGYEHRLAPIVQDNMSGRPPGGFCHF